jgi:hypothetical protein
MPLSPIETQQHDVRLTLTVPNNGRVIIEGKLQIVAKFWDDVKMDFIGAVSDVLKNQPFTKGEFEPVAIESELRNGDA